MTSSTISTAAGSSSRVTVGLAATGAVAVMGLIPLTALVGEWWLLAATFAVLAGTAALVVLALLRLLARTGDSASRRTAEVSSPEPAAGTRAAVRRPRGALVRSA